MAFNLSREDAQVFENKLVYSLITNIDKLNANKLINTTTTKSNRHMKVTETVRKTTLLTKYVKQTILALEILLHSNILGLYFEDVMTLLNEKMRDIFKLIFDLEKNKDFVEFHNSLKELLSDEIPMSKEMKDQYVNGVSNLFDMIISQGENVLQAFKNKNITYIAGMKYLPLYKLLRPSSIDTESPRRSMRESSPFAFPLDDDYQEMPLHTQSARFSPNREMPELPERPQSAGKKLKKTHIMYENKKKKVYGEDKNRYIIASKKNVLLSSIKGKYKYC